MGHVFEPNARARHLQDDRRRQDVEEGALRRRCDRRRSRFRWIPSIRQRSTRRCGRRSVCRGSSPAAAPAAGCTRRPTAARIGRIFRAIPATPRGVLGKHRRRGFGSGPARRLLDRAGEGRRRLPFGRRRRDVEANATTRWKLRQRAFYYMAIYVDPTNPQNDLRAQRRLDCGYRTTAARRLRSLRHAARRQSHRLDQSDATRKFCSKATTAARRFPPTAARRGAPITISRPGSSITSRSTTSFPFHIYGAQQDEGAYRRPERVGRAAPSAIGDWQSVALGESTFVAPQPGNPDDNLRQRLLSDRSCSSTRTTGAARRTSARGRVIMAGASSAETEVPFRLDASRSSSRRRIRKELLIASQVRVVAATITGKTWQASSPDLTRNDPSTEGPDAAARRSAIKPAPKSIPTSRRSRFRRSITNVMWAGSADGLVHVTKDHGAHWSAVTPPAAAADGRRSARSNRRTPQRARHI